MIEQQSLNFNKPILPQLVGGERLIADSIMQATSKRPVSIAELLVMTSYKVKERRIKQIVEEMRDSGTIVCANRNKPKGYYIPKTQQEIQDGLKGYLAQSITQIKKVMRLLRSQGYAELAGQMRLDCEAALKDE